METACAYCNKPVESNDKNSVSLADSKIICGDCVSKVLILYPKSYTWARFKHVYNEDYEADYFRASDDDDAFWLDPLSEMTYQEYIDTVSNYTASLVQ